MNKEIQRPEASPGGDDELVRAFQAGNRFAFDKLVRKHQDRIFNLCYRFFGDYQDANDFAQEVFIKVYQSLNKFRYESSFSTWLYRIAVNTCKNRLRSIEYRFRLKPSCRPARRIAISPCFAYCPLLVML